MPAHRRGREDKCDELPFEELDRNWRRSGRFPSWCSCREDLRLDCGHELFRISETKPEVGQVCLLVAFEARDFRLRRLPGRQLRHQPDPPNQLRHLLTLVP
jgi:hypothetical protein